MARAQRKSITVRKKDEVICSHIYRKSSFVKEFITNDTFSCKTRRAISRRKDSPNWFILPCHGASRHIGVSKNETMAVLVSQTNLVPKVEKFSYVSNFFCSNEFAYLHSRSQQDPPILEEVGSKCCYFWWRLIPKSGFSASFPSTHFCLFVVLTRKIT